LKPCTRIKQVAALLHVGLQVGEQGLGAKFDGRALRGLIDAAVGDRLLVAGDALCGLDASGEVVLQRLAVPRAGVLAGLRQQRLHAGGIGLEGHASETQVLHAIAGKARAVARRREALLPFVGTVGGEVEVQLHGEVPLKKARSYARAGALSILIPPALSQARVR
jgi:hypothetical protein